MSVNAIHIPTLYPGMGDLQRYNAEGFIPESRLLYFGMGDLQYLERRLEGSGLIPVTGQEKTINLSVGMGNLKYFEAQQAGILFK